MTQSPPPGVRAIAGRLNTVLAGVVILLAIAVVVVLAAGNKVLPWSTAAEDRAHTYTDARAAAEKAVLAFTDVDYRDMKEKAHNLQDASTGSFAAQYASTAGDLAAAAKRSKAVSTGTVDQVGLRSVSGSTATALVAAEVVVHNSATTKMKKTKSCPYDGARCEKYRFLVTLTDTATGWKMSDLAGVS